MRKQKGKTEFDMQTGQMTCKKCHATWSPNLKEGGKLPRGAWKCLQCEARAVAFARWATGDTERTTPLTEAERITIAREGTKEVC